jgi:hypothetical protein
MYKQGNYLFFPPIHFEKCERFRRRSRMPRKRRGGIRGLEYNRHALFALLVCLAISHKLCVKV